MSRREDEPMPLSAFLALIGSAMTIGYGLISAITLIAHRLAG